MLDDYNFVERELKVDALKEYAVGVRRHQIDVQTRLLGWRLNDRWYLGRRKGDADGIGLIWQKGETQTSLTPEGSVGAVSFPVVDSSSPARRTQAEPQRSAQRSVGWCYGLRARVRLVKARFT
jgi:hypothetical protein